ncbi:AI-2E family transporter [Dongia mobilis]|uniref:AI-2E family transporter n=1 Tax=Dongia sp. TaxID=1977262 RepID=UPI0026EF76E5
MTDSRDINIEVEEAVVPRMRRWPSYLAALIVFLLLVYLLRTVLLPFVAGMGVAYFLDPVCDRLEKWCCSRILATTLVTIAFVLIVVLGFLLVVPLLIDQLSAFITSLPELVERAHQRLLPLYESLRLRFDLPAVDDLGPLLRNRLGTVFGFITQALQGVVSGGAALANLLSLLFITPVVTFYLLRDWDIITARLDHLLPRDHAETIREQGRAIDTTLAGFIRGQATVCLVLGVFYAVSLMIVGLPFGLIIGMIAGLLTFIPYVGCLSGLVISMAIALASFDTWHGPVAVAAVFVVGQVVEGNFLTPKLVGDRVGLHPVWIIFALLAGGALFGFVGLLLAVPVAAAIGVLVRFGIGRYLSSPLYQGHDQVMVPEDVASAKIVAGTANEP